MLINFKQLVINYSSNDCGLTNYIWAISRIKTSYIMNQKYNKETAV